MANKNHRLVGEVAAAPLLCMLFCHDVVVLFFCWLLSVHYLVAACRTAPRRTSDVALVSTLLVQNQAQTRVIIKPV